jgi:hypothetical protein
MRWMVGCWRFWGLCSSDARYEGGEEGDVRDGRGI